MIFFQNHFMKSLRNIIITLTIILLVHGSLWSQQGALKFNANYSVAIPTGQFKDLTDQPSGRGLYAGVLYGATDQLFIGLSVGFQDFYQKYSRTVLHDGGSDLSAVISNSIQTIPILAKAKYIFSQEGTLRPYGAVGAGVNLGRYEKYYGQFVDSYSKIRFAAQPEAGINIPVGSMKRAMIELAAAYSILPFQYNDADGFNHLSLKLGISVPMQR